MEWEGLIVHLQWRAEEQVEEQKSYGGWDKDIPGKDPYETEAE